MVIAFLNSDVEEEVYIQVFKVSKCQINATLYRLNFTRCDSDPCLYVRKEKREFVIIAVYVDDLILPCNSSGLLSKGKPAS